MADILLFDRDIERGRNTCNALEKLGYNVTPVNNDVELKEKLQSDYFKCVLIDATLPRNKFIEIVDIIRLYSKETDIIALGSQINVNGVRSELYEIPRLVFTIEEIVQENRKKPIRTTQPKPLSKQFPRQERIQLYDKKRINLIEQRIANYIQKHFSSR